MKLRIVLLPAAIVALALATGCKPKPTTPASPASNAPPVVSKTAAPLPESGFKAQITLADSPSQLRAGQKEVITVKVKNAGDVVRWHLAGRDTILARDKAYPILGDRCLHHRRNLTPLEAGVTR